MDEILKRLSDCVEFGKIDRETQYPPEMKGMDGAKELTREALDLGISPNEILDNALVSVAYVGHVSDLWILIRLFVFFQT